MAIVALLVVSLLITLLARLWYLQVLAGEEAQQLATRTSVRIVQEEAPRGFIFDRHGETLAQNRTALTVAMDVSRLPVPGAERENMLSRLATVLDVELESLREIVEDPRIGHHTPRPIALDVGKDTVIHLREHRDAFPGVTDMEIPVREYPQHELAAHVVGHIGEINSEELESLDGYEPGAKIGKIGLERMYEEWLRGTPGIEQIAVNVRGERVQHLGSRPPERGWDAILTVDADVQRAAQESLARGIEVARGIYDPDSGESYSAPAGAVVALDPNTGEVLALASQPTFDPNVFVGPVPVEELARLNDPDAHFPMLNRAVAAAFSPGSTFKPITAAAAWDAGLLSPERTLNCPAHYRVGDRLFRDWTRQDQGLVDMSTAIARSCNTAFVQLGVELNDAAGRIGEHLQATARSFGFGEPTGIDLLGERSGLVPDAAWKEERFEEWEPEDRRWFAGDAANLAIGQGFLQVTPLQLAVAYGAIANGGTLYRPHVMKCLAELDVSRPVSSEEACRNGEVPETAAPHVLGRVDAPPDALAHIAQAMVGTQRGIGTAADAFDGFPIDVVPVAGKTGTAEMRPRQAFSWFAAFAPADDPEIVVVALVEEGGTGSEIATPIARRVIERYFGIPEGGFEPGARAD